MKFLHLLWCNLKRKKLRTLLTVFSILVAFLLFGFLAAVRTALEGGVSVAGADRLVVRHKVSLIQLLPESYEARMEKIPGVASAVHATWFGGVYKEPKNFFGSMPVDAKEFLEMYPEYVLPEDQKQKWLETRTGAIVGSTTAKRFEWKIGDRIPLESMWTQVGGKRTWEFELVGIYDGAKKGTDTTQFFFRHDYFEEAREFAKGQVGWYTVRVADPSRAEEVAKKIDEEFENSAAETKAETEGAFVRSFAKQLGDIGAIMSGILAVVFFTILLVAGNTMAQAVRERTEELGVLKALGFTNTQVLLMVLKESCLLAGLGGFLGLGLAWLIIAGGDPTRGALPNFYFPTNYLLFGVAMVLGLGLITGLIPAVQAMRLRIADALRRT